MKIAFFHKGYEDLGIQALSAYLKQRGHEVDLYYDGSTFSSNVGLDNALLSRLFDVSAIEFERRVAERMSVTPPDVIGLAGPTANYRWSLRWARWAKERFGVPVVYGGPHATTAPETVIREDCVDALVRGEGELALAELMDTVAESRFQNTTIPSVWFKEGEEIVRNPVRAYLDDLDSLPFFDKELFGDKVEAFYKQYMTMSGRGCPFQCTYCNQAAYKELYGRGAKHLRRRSPDHVIAELEQVTKHHDVRFVSFRDDVFSINSTWLERFAELYAGRIALPFFCYGHPRTITDSIAEALAEAGCRQIKIGVQSFDEDVRREKLNRNYSNEDIFAATQRLKARGVEVLIDHMLLLPGETEDEVAHAVDQYIELQPDSITNFHLVLFPGTPMLDMALEQGTISTSQREAIDRGEEPTEFSNPDPVTRRANKRKLKYQYYMDLIPLLPKKLVRFLFDHRLMHLLPYSYSLRQLFSALSDIANRNIRLRYMLWYILSNKRFP